MTENRDPSSATVSIPIPPQVPDLPSGLRGRPFIALNLCFSLSVGGWTPMYALLAIIMRDHLGAGVLAAMTAFLVSHTIGTGVSLYAGAFATSWGSRRAYLVGVSGMVLAAALLSAANEGWQVIALAPLIGLMMPFHWTGVNTYLLQAVNARRRGTATGISAFVMVLAPGVFGPILTTLGEAVGIWAMILAAAAIMALAGLGAWRFLPDLGPAEATSGRSRRPSFAAYPRLLAGRANLIIAGARLVAGTSFGLFQLLSALVLLDLTGELSSVGFYLAAGAIGGGASQVLIGAASDRFGRRNLLVFAMLVGAGAAFLFWGGGSLGWLLVAATMQWFAQSAFQTLITAINGDLVAARDVPAVSGLHVGIFSFGLMLGSLLGGTLWQFGSELPFLVAGLCFIPVIASLFFLPQRTLVR